MATTKPGKRRSVKIELSETDALLVREYLAHGVRNGFQSAAKRKRAVHLAEHVFLHAVLQLEQES